ncbi:hypothetical protein FDK21_18295 [Cohaesibacter sp. CAU 1516]|uniref:acetate uptake transporter n=1 Tax=Cohaesibacter sp. CAU 1516 TaxID=2576038 RepID=UPI0010FF2571|nr:GPR1/FUN34/YaaH family transporter [Cohaesibacter sp. CAU 1516]TLP43165.1 hypothetical protein FDK21_18295 [Cohaesibacter sp. CAU 1516]
MSSKGAINANPAVVGLGGFALTTFLLQIHNLGLIETGPVVWVGFIYGGLAQMIAGFQEQKTGNHFGYSAFASYGAFWIALCLIFMGNHYGVFVSSATDIGWFLVAWTIYTVFMMMGAIRVHGAMATTFALLLAGFILLDIGHFGFPVMNTVAAFVLIGCAFSAWYMMIGAILKDVYGHEILPMGKPWVQNHPAELLGQSKKPPMAPAE